MMTDDRTRLTLSAGFTLIELSIVLVIIGLIVGGILVGQDMIAAARIRGTISQVDKFNAAVNTFRSKYGYLPGDIIPTAASAFGFLTRAGSAGHGDGNGLIQSEALNNNGLVWEGPSGEILLFWADLSAANLIEGNYKGQDCGGSGTCNSAGIGNTGNFLTYYSVGDILPPAKIGRANYFHVYSEYGINYYELLGGSNMNIQTDGNFYNNASGSYYGSNFRAMTPLEAFSIDSKIDNGYPTTGTVISRQGTFYYGHGTDDENYPGPAGAAAAANCGNTDTTPTSYNTGAAYANLVVCAIHIKTSF